MLQISYLRLGGMYAESADAAIMLRTALERVLDLQRVRPTLAAFVELQAGISLQLAGCSAQAQQAYNASYQWAQVSGKHFLMADAAGKLALACALDGKHEEARQWLSLHAQAIEEVAWGRKMLERGAELTRAYQALNELDVNSARALLENLPQAPDSDEFWVVHTYLLALCKVHEGIPEAARSLVATMLEERKHAGSALTIRMLDDASKLIGILDAGSIRAALDPRLEPNVLTALQYFIDERPDEALSVVEQEPPEAGSRRWASLLKYLKLVARHPGKPSPELLQQVARLYRDSGNLFELSLLLRIPQWSGARNLLGLTPEELLRLDSSGTFDRVQTGPRPRLTAREQEILQQLRAGMSRREIAEAGFRSENTVKTQVRSLYRKLNASDLSQALENARFWGL